MIQEGNSGTSKPYCFVIMSFGDNLLLQDCYELGIKHIVGGKVT